MDEREFRQAVIKEAVSWAGTPYHLGSRLKSIGCDCATFILQVMINAGVFTEERLGIYSQDWWCHTSEDKYLMHVLRHARRVCKTICYRSTKIEPGNIILVKTNNSRVFNHGAIVLDYPMAIHAMPPAVMPVLLSGGQPWSFKEIEVFNPYLGPEEQNVQ